MTLEEHIEAEKRVASGFLVACQTTREADEFGVYGKEAQMYEDKYYAHTERADLLEELKDRREGKAACESCEYETRSEMQWPCVSCSHNHTDKYRPKITTENDWHGIPAEEMTKEQAQKAVKELRKALLIFENRFCKHCGAEMKGGAE